MNQAGFLHRLREIDMFFAGRSKEHRTLRRLSQRLAKEKIAYAIMGGMAVNAHRHERTTNDVDVLVTPEGLERFRTKFVGKQYLRVEGRDRRFTDKDTGVTIDVLVTGGIPGFGKPGPIRFPDPADVGETIDTIQVVNFQTLIELKLAARRHQDFADVVNLIRIHNLDDSFQDELHSSVRRDFLECLDEKRRDDEYKEREGIG